MLTIPKFFTYAEVARLLTCSRTTVFDLVKRGDLAVVRISPQVVRITADEVERFLNERMARSASPSAAPARRRVAKRVLRPRDAAPQPAAS
jgi:excisionase family DNA binding protein